MKAILSIKPEFVMKMFKGEKKFEYRRKIFKKEVETVIIYATMPIKAIVGDFTIENIFYDEINLLWDLTKEYAGINKSYFYEYFMKTQKGFAIKIKEVRQYEKYLTLESFGITYPPQNYVYIR